MSNPLVVLPEHLRHSRTYGENRFVYPVISRRSKGLSLGINLNPDKVCNFDCVYCQVDRRSDAETPFVDVDTLYAELDATLDCIATGEIFQDPGFVKTPPSARRLNDIAFAGDGEPTTVPNFHEIVQHVAAIKRERRLADVKLIVLTNASMLHRPNVTEALAILMKHDGEIWAKLDAGTGEYYQRIMRTPIPFARILENLVQTAMRFPLVIQSMFLRFAGESPGDAEIDAYIQRLEDILNQGGRLQLIQVYTVARPPAVATVSALYADELDRIAQRVRERISVPVEAFYGGAV